MIALKKTEMEGQKERQYSTCCRVSTKAISLPPNKMPLADDEKGEVKWGLLVGGGNYDN
jgi:hypothetical protein